MTPERIRELRAIQHTDNDTITELLDEVERLEGIPDCEKCKHCIQSAIYDCPGTADGVTCFEQDPKPLDTREEE